MRSWQNRITIQKLNPTMYVSAQPGDNRHCLSGFASGGTILFPIEPLVCRVHPPMSPAVSIPQTSPLHRSVTTLYGVGPERTAQLGRLGIHTVEELLLHRPNRYEDRQHLQPIAQLELHQPASVHGKLVTLGTKWFRQHTKSVFEIVLDDGTARLHCRWWNLPYMERYFRVGDEVLAFGKPVSLKPRVMDHAETEVLEGGEESFIHLNRIAPIYPLTEGLPQRWLRSLIWRTLQAFAARVVDPWNLPDPSNASPGKLPSRAQAIRLLHF